MQILKQINRCFWYASLIIQIMEFRYFILLVLSLSSLCFAQVSTNQSPNPINTAVDISATKDSLQNTHYFAFQQLSSDVYNEEWYAFLVAQAKQKQQWMKYHVYITTISKQTGVVNPTKVQCTGGHNDLQMCYFSGSRIDIKTQNLQVDFIFQKPTQLTIKIEINKVKNLKIGEKFVMQKDNTNFTNIIRIDLRDLKEQFTYFFVEFGEDIIVDQYKNSQSFIASKELTPPDSYRFSVKSIILWDNVVGSVLSFQDLQEVQYLTFLMGITDRNTYVFRTKLIYKVSGPQQLQIGRSYNQVIDLSKTYNAQLPKAKSNTTFFLLKIHLNYFYDIILSNLTINGVSLQQNQIQLFLQQNLLNFNRQYIVKLNYTIQSLNFTLNFTFGGILTISIRQIDTSFIELQPKQIWSDQISFNKTQYLYFVVDSSTSQETINLQVDFQVTYPHQYQINFKNCVEKTVQKCKQIALSSNQTLKFIGLTALQPQVQPKYFIKSYSFLNLTITKYQMAPNHYQSILVVQIKAKSPVLRYFIEWFMTSQMRLLKQKELIKMHGQKEQVIVYYFTVIDATNISFARIHYQSSSESTILFGSTKLFNTNTILQQLYDENTHKNLIMSFQNSLTFTNIQNQTTYYLYVLSKQKFTYQMQLTFGYNLQGNIQRPISFLTVGENSKTQLTMQPYEVMFVEVRLLNVAFMHLSNSIPLKVCFFVSDFVPKTYEDIKSTSYCQIFMTVNSIRIFNNNNNGKSYVGIQNQNNKSCPLEIITQIAQIRCNHVQMGKTYIFMISKNNDQSKFAYCVSYIITHKADVQILVDLHNPKLTGTALPSIKLGKTWNTVMTQNLKILTGEEIDSYCLGQYEQCKMIINFQIDEDHHIKQEQISITVSYTDQPLTLKDGLAHKSTLRPQQVKHFKYPLFSFNNLTATIKSEIGSLNCYARIITNYDRFSYPQEQQVLLKNSSQIYRSVKDHYFYPASLTISQDKIKEQCHDSDHSYLLCYVLFSVYGKKQYTYDVQFLIQVTQSVSFLKEGQKLQKYIEKQSVAYFNYKNSHNNSNLLFFTGSTNQNCLSLDVVQGNSKIGQFTDYQSGKTQILVLNATQQWYSLLVTAQQSCYFTIQVSSSRKPIREVSFGYAHLISLQTGQKIYYILPNQDLVLIKLIISMKLQKMGQVIIRAIPVTDSQLTDYIKFINDELQINKKTNLTYAWTDTNSLTIRESDRKFCKNCHICVQIQASKSVQGYLTIPQTSNSISFYLPGTLSTDILLKGQYYNWKFTYTFVGYSIIIKIQAGSIKIGMQGSFEGKANQTILTFDNNKYQKNQIEFAYQQQGSYRNDIKITALQNSIYSISSRELLTENEDFTYIQVGRPEYVYLQNHRSSCYAGQLDNQYQQLILTSLYGSYQSIKDQDLSFSFLQVTASIDSQSVTINKETLRNIIMFSFDKQQQINNKPFKICFSLKQQTEEQYLEGKLIFLGNLNYLPEDSSMHFRKSRNLTFMSQGKGIIEVDQCGSRSQLFLNSKYQDINNMNSKITQRRIGNNLIAFDNYGPVYLNTESKDYVTLRWRNYKYQGNGRGYQMFSPSTFRLLYDASSQQLSLKIKPIQNTSQDYLGMLQFTEMVYQVYIAKQESDLYNAMNCQKGDYMFWTKSVQKVQEMTAQCQMKLNNIKDLQTLFKNSQYVLIIVRAEVMIRWSQNNVTQNYRFYYSYQQMLLSQFSVQKVSQQTGTASNASQQSSSSPILLIIVIFLTIAVILLIVLVVCIIRKLKKRALSFDLMPQQQIANSEVLTNSKAENQVNENIKSFQMKNM